jgi:hypothetical protein
MHGHKVLNMWLRDHWTNNWVRFDKPRERNCTITSQDPVSAVCVRHIRHMEVYQLLGLFWDFPQRDGNTRRAGDTISLRQHNTCSLLDLNPMLGQVSFVTMCVSKSDF